MLGEGFSHLVLMGMLALVFDRFLGDPDWLWRRLPHPVVLFGHAIHYAEKWTNHLHKPVIQRYFYGTIVIILLVAGAALAGFFCTIIFRAWGQGGIVAEAFVASLFLAHKSLVNHVQAVKNAFASSIASRKIKTDLGQARHEVAKIVGRNTEQLDEAGICRAAIESLSENSSDGIVAPFFWLLLFGLPGIFAYKMLNTADSMIGHKSERFHAFGFATAKADDVANYLPARFCALITIVASRFIYGRGSCLAAWRTMRTDAKQHRSPNAGWIESVYAGALGISLSGPRHYADICVNDSFLNAHGRAPNRDDIDAAITLFQTTMNLILAILALFYGTFFLL